MTHNCPAGLVAVPYENLTICVTPDYYMVDGSRVPFTLAEAFDIADAQGMILPTTAMVDAIWRHADIQLPPRPLNPSNTSDANFYNNLVDPKYNLMHNSIIEQQLAEHEVGPSTLIAGHKKDIVLHDRSSSRIAIGSRGNKGKPKSEEHKRKIAEAIRKKNADK